MKKLTMLSFILCCSLQCFGQEDKKYTDCIDIPSNSTIVLPKNLSKISDVLPLNESWSLFYKDLHDKEFALLSTIPDYEIQKTYLKVIVSDSGKVVNVLPVNHSDLYIKYKPVIDAFLYNLGDWKPAVAISDSGIHQNIPDEFIIILFRQPHELNTSSDL